MEYVDTAVRYGRQLGNTLLGVEGFTEDSSGNVVVNKNAIAGAMGLIGLYILVMMLVGLLVAFGAARQSYCYNIYIGNTEGVAILFAILCFFFPHFYYPFYALFLNPVCDLGKKNKGVMGGLMGGRRR